MMGCRANEVLAVAAGEIGYREKKTNARLDDATANAGSANYTKYARDLFAAGFWNGNKNGYDWCTSFVAWCFWRACLGDVTEAKNVQPYGPYGASCKWQTQYYQAAKRWDSTPHVGDQAFFTRGHTGLVEKFDGKKLTLIEGNSNNRVERRTYKWPNAAFSGFGRPRYAAAPAEPKPEDPPVFQSYSVKVTPSNGLNVRTGAGTGYAKLGALKCGTVIRILGEAGGWGRILYKQKTGWVCLTYTKKV